MRVLFFALCLVFSLPANAAWVFPDKSADVVADQTLLKTTWDGILVQAKSYAGATLNGVGGLPSVSSTLSSGAVVQLNMNRYSSDISAVGVLVMFCGLLLSLYIIFS